MNRGVNDTPLLLTLFFNKLEIHRFFRDYSLTAFLGQRILYLKRTATHIILKVINELVDVTIYLKTTLLVYHLMSDQRRLCTRVQAI